MNRVLVFAEEIGPGGLVELVDARFAHIREVLGGDVGDRVRAGVLRGALHDEARIAAIDGYRCVLELGEGRAPPRLPSVDLLLALPRPKSMKRLWPQLAAMGVGRIFIVNAEKVEPAYWGAQVLREKAYMPLVVEGLAQAGDTRVPEIRVERRLKPLLEDEISVMYGEGCKFLAHPGDYEPSAPLGGGALLVAVGPEGGWSSYELDMFTDNGFTRIGLGERTLRTDTACIALLAVAGHIGDLPGMTGGA